MPSRVLIVENDDLLSDILVSYLQQAGQEASCETTAAGAIARLDAGEPVGLVFVDLDFHSSHGIWLVREIRKRAAMPIVVMTAHPSLEDATRALEAGAMDVLVKPFPREAIHSLVKTYLGDSVSEAPRVERRRQSDGIGLLVGKHPKMLAVVRLVEEFARCDAPVLITGETGTGKEVVARAMHGASRWAKWRRSRPDGGPPRSRWRALPLPPRGRASSSSASISSS